VHNHAAHLVFIAGTAANAFESSKVSGRYFQVSDAIDF
jgi:hypothetical protein